jgi:hypothetical protein
MAVEPRPRSEVRAGWFVESVDPAEASGPGVVVRAWFDQPDACKPVALPVWLVETVAFCPHGLFVRQAAQLSQPDKVIVVQITPIKAIPGFMPIGFSFPHG